MPYRHNAMLFFSTRIEAIFNWEAFSEDPQQYNKEELTDNMKIEFMVWLKLGISNKIDK